MPVGLYVGCGVLSTFMPKFVYLWWAAEAPSPPEDLNAAFCR